VSSRDLPVTVMVNGSATGPALVLDEPLSMWGGLDAETGLIIDQRHPQCGQCVTGTIVVMDAGRGSSSASSVLAEAVRLGTAPVGFVMADVDEIVALGSLVAEEIYGTVTPIVVASTTDTSTIRTGDTISIDSAILRLP
jgi:predicted aconitase with swiveling domain